MSTDGKFFCVEEPNFATISIPDSRFENMCRFYKPHNDFSNYMELVDIMGIEKPDKKDDKKDGRGADFYEEHVFKHLAKVDGIYHVARAFESKQSDMKKQEPIDPIRDLKFVNEQII